MCGAENKRFSWSNYKACEMQFKTYTCFTVLFINKYFMKYIWFNIVLLCYWKSNVIVSSNHHEFCYSHQIKKLNILIGPLIQQLAKQWSFIASFLRSELDIGDFSELEEMPQPLLQNIEWLWNLAFIAGSIMFYNEFNQKLKQCTTIWQ